MTAAMSAWICSVFLPTARSFRLFCLVICVVFLFCLSWFSAVHFSAHTGSLVIPALFSMVLFCSLIYDFTFFCVPLPVCLWPCISLHLSGPLLVFQGRFDFRYLQCFDCLFGKLFNRWPKLDSSHCLQNFKRSVGCFGRDSIHTLEFLMSTDLYVCLSFVKTSKKLHLISFLE